MFVICKLYFFFHSIHFFPSAVGLVTLNSLFGFELFFLFVMLFIQCIIEYNLYDCIETDYAARGKLTKSHSIYFCIGKDYTTRGKLT